MNNTDLQITKRSDYNQIIRPETAFFEYFTDYADNYLKNISKGVILTEKKVKFSEETIRIYKSAINHFKDFQNLLQSPIRTQELNKSFLVAFERYLVSMGLTLNSVSVYQSKIKSLANQLLNNDIIQTTFKAIKTPKEETTQVYLTYGEIAKINNAKLTNGEAIVRDIFLCQIYCGLRFSTLKKLLSNPFAYIKNHGEQSYIDIVADKNNEQCVIPLHSEIVRIINKYEAKVPMFSDQYIRRTIKTICEKAEINQPTPTRVTKNGKIVEVLVEKYQLCSSHTARRTFISLLKQENGIEDKIIIAMTGHANIQMLSTYSRVSKLEVILPIMDNNFFKKSF